MSEDRPLVRCKNCKHESGIGFDAWCALGLSRHDISNAIYCDSFKRWDYDNSNEYKEIEIVDGNQLILWKHDNSGQKFTHAEFIKFLNEKCHCGDQNNDETM